MKIRTSELNGAALDWAVAKCRSVEFDLAPDGYYTYKPSTNWAQGGPLIERECIDLQYQGGDADVWAADMFDAESMVYGNTPLIAAMRCYVASKLGDEVDIPKELV